MMAISSRRHYGVACLNLGQVKVSTGGAESGSSRSCKYISN